MTPADPSGTQNAERSPAREDAGPQGDSERPVSGPDITKMGRALEAVQVRSLTLTLLIVLAILYTLYFARAFVVPIVFAILLTFFFSPLVRGLERVRLRPPLGAAVVLLAVLGLVTLGVYELSEPAQRWAAKAPQVVADAGAKLQRLKEPVEQVSRTAEQIENVTDVGGATDAQEVVVKQPGLVSRLFGTTQDFLAGLLEVLILLYFLLAAGDLFLEKLIKVIPQFRDKKKAVRIARETETSISTYLFTVALVNLGEGTVLATALWLLQMPNPVLWGVMAALFEFVPYIGATVTLGILTLAALTSLDSVGHALLVPASFLAINLMQANFVSPLLLGHRLTLNPVAIIVGLAFWWWMWGVPGAFIAVPLLAAFKIFCDHIETLAPVGEFLGK